MRLGCQIKLDDAVFERFMEPSAEPFPGEWAGQIPDCPGVRFALISETDAQTGVSRRRLAVTNEGAAPVTLYAAHIAYELPYPHARLSYFTSDWGSEFSPVNLDVTYPVQISTQSGRSCKGCDPFFRVSAVRGGRLLGVSVGWSGNWQASVCRVNEPGLNHVYAGMLEAGFAHVIAPGETFQNIEIFDCYQEDPDEELLSARFRRYYQRHISLLPKDWDSLPVVFNHWWPYEDKWINEDVFYDNAVAAKKIGCTNTLLDAGWFGPSETPDPGKSMPWFLKRGDWTQENATLFPSGVAELGRKVNEQAGIPFGIWCEIEAVGDEAELHGQRPELIARRDGQSLGYVCMGNPETRAWAMGVLERLVEQCGAKWIKLDFNLDPGFGCDCQAHGHGKSDGIWAHYQGYYQFLDEVRARWPRLILENCSSGGLRIDYGLMQHVHFLFLSDPDYTRHHLQCYWGALSHIHPSACYHFTQSHIVGDHNLDYDEDGNATGVTQPITDQTPVSALDYMVRACMTGELGFSLKLVELPEWALERIQRHIALYKRFSGDYLLRGDAWRLTPQTCSVPGRGASWCAFQLQADAARSLLFVFKSDNLARRAVIKPRALTPELTYALRFHGGGPALRRTGAELMADGLAFQAEEKQWSEVVEITAE